MGFLDDFKIEVPFPKCAIIAHEDASHENKPNKRGKLQMTKKFRKIRVETRERRRLCSRVYEVGACEMICHLCQVKDKETQTAGYRVILRKRHGGGLRIPCPTLKMAKNLFDLLVDERVDLCHVWDVVEDLMCMDILSAQTSEESSC